MVCRTCGNQHAARIRIVAGTERCAVCGGFSEAKGARADGVLSRQRTRDQGVKYEGDTLNPWQYSRAERAFEPNPDFIKLHARNARNFYRPEDLRRYPKLAESLGRRAADGTKVEGTGDGAQAMREVIAAS